MVTDKGARSTLKNGVLDIHLMKTQMNKKYTKK